MLTSTFLVVSFVAKPPVTLQTKFNGDWSIDPIALCTMHTFVTEWNDIRQRKGMVSDSEYMKKWKPCDTQLCLAISTNNVCYALAQINEKFAEKGVPTRKYIRGICTSPSDQDMGSILMENLVDNNFEIEPEMIRHQPRWLIAYSYLVD